MTHILPRSRPHVVRPELLFDFIAHCMHEWLNLPELGIFNIERGNVVSGSLGAADVPRVAAGRNSVPAIYEKNKNRTAAW